jgi:16S rRNA (guanine527-N7)-methyltransferase
MQPDKEIPQNRFASGAQSRRDIDRFVALLREWQHVHNLVSRTALDDLWDRHILDSLQLLDHAPDFREWVDLGSGAGFPGLVVAIAFKGDPERHFTLVESNGKKAAFLRAAIRETGVNAGVAAKRIERHAETMGRRADVVSARALAPLPALCTLAEPYMHQNSILLLLKGRDFEQELSEAAKSWNLDVLNSPSATDPGGRVLAIRNLSPKLERI